MTTFRCVSLCRLFSPPTSLAPPCSSNTTPTAADTSAQEAPPTQDDFAKVIRVVQARDERIHTAESELRHLREDLSRVIEENKRLREEILLSLIHI